MDSSNSIDSIKGKDAEEDIVGDGDDSDVFDESFSKDVPENSPPYSPDILSMNMDLIERLVGKVGDRIREDMGVIFEGLKVDLLNEIAKRDAEISKSNARTTELENEVQFLRDSMASSMASSGSKINALENKVVELSASIDAIKAASLVVVFRVTRKTGKNG